MKKNSGFMKKIKELREEINNIDEKIIELLNKRGKLAQQIGSIKKLIGIDTFQLQREDEIIQRMIAKSKILKDESIKAIWKEIMDACKIIQEI